MTETYVPLAPDEPDDDPLVLARRKDQVDRALFRRLGHTPVNDELRAEIVAEICRLMSEGTSYLNACRLTNISQVAVWGWRKRFPEVEEAITDANIAYKTFLEAVADKRAVHGIVKHVVSGGKVVAKERIYSDRLLEKRLERLDPAYRQNSHHHQISGSVAHTVAMKPPSDDDIDQWVKGARELDQKVRDARQSLVIEGEATEVTGGGE